MNPFTSPDFDEHEHVAFLRDGRTGLRAIVAIHSTAPIGIAGGGCRWWRYATEDDALRDALRLSRAMSYKLALVGLPAGGAKAVVLGCPEQPKDERHLRALGRLLHRLAGRFIAAEDVGTTPEDLEWVRRETPFVAPHVAGQDTAEATAGGVLLAIQTALHHRGRELRGARVLVQGAGRVGAFLLQRLAEAGAVVLVSDIDSDALARAVQSTGATAVPPTRVLDAEVDVYAPCALGDVLDRAAVQRLRCLVVAGSANNPLVDSDVATELDRRGVLYCPDFVCNAGGVIGAARAGAAQMGAVADVLPTLDRIAALLEAVFERAAREGSNPEFVARAMAREAIARMRA